MKNEQELIKELEKIEKRLTIYQKKEQTMGLTENEKEKLKQTFANFLKTTIKYDDVKFNNEILPYVLKDKALKTHNDLNKIFKWDLSAIIDTEEMDKYQKQYKKVKDKEKFEELLVDLYCYLKENTEEYLKLFAGIPEVIKEFEELGIDYKKSVLDFLAYKFTTLKFAIGIGEINEKID